MSDAGDRFVESVGASLTAQGFPRIPASVLLALTVVDDASATSSELVQRLRVSAAAVSGAIRYLSTLGFVRITTLPGGRRHRYTLRTDPPWYTGTLAESSRYRDLAKLITDAAQSVEPGPAQRRIADMADFFRFLDRRMPALLDEWLAEQQSQRGRPPSAECSRPVNP